MTVKVRVFESAAELLEEAVEMLSKEVADTLEQKENCRMALAGGTTPLPVYKRLFGPLGLDDETLSRIVILFGDERCVPPEDPDSNYGAVRAVLKDRMELFLSVERMRGEAQNPLDAAKDAADGFATPLDILLLGLGEDCHVASLFPGSEAFDSDGRVVPVVGPKPPPRRLTITPRVIREARRVVVLARGIDKAEAVRQVFSGPADPVRYPGQLAKGGTWFLDSGAAWHLDRGMIASIERQ